MAIGVPILVCEDVKGHEEDIDHVEEYDGAAGDAVDAVDDGDAVGVPASQIPRKRWKTRP